MIWLYWAFLWALFFLVLGLGKRGLTRYTGAVAAIAGWVTGAIPAFLLLTGVWDDANDRRRRSPSRSSASPRLLLARGCAGRRLSSRPHPPPSCARATAPPRTAPTSRRAPGQDHHRREDVTSLLSAARRPRCHAPRPAEPREATMPEVVFPLDSTKKFTDQKSSATTAGTRDIPAPCTVKPGDVFRVHCREWFDGAIHNDDSADDILDAPLTTVHVLSGPFAVEGAKPGDLLIVDILDVGPIPQEDSGPLAGQGWGYTGIFATQQRRRLPHRPVPRRLQGDLGLHRPDRDLPAHPRGVASPASIHPGLMGTAPSAELLAKWNTREQALIATDPDRVPPLALPPRAAGRGPRVAAPAPSSTGSPPRPPAPHRPGRTAATRTSRTSPRARRVFYPVFVDGANLSMGDLHFSQGDGEITFCGAIEMGGFIDLHVDLIKGGMETYGVSRERDLHAGQRRPAVQRVAGLLGHVGHAGRRAALPGLAPVLPARLPARDRLPDEVRLQPASRRT